MKPAPNLFIRRWLILLTFLGLCAGCWLPIYFGLRLLYRSLS